MDETRPRRRFPWLKAALTLSLVLNLALVGVLFGVVNRVGQSGTVLRLAVAALPVEDRRALRRETGQIWREARQARGRTSGNARMIAALRAEEFDAAPFAEALREAQQRLLDVSDEIHQQLVTRVTQMSPDERAAYADALEARMHERRWRGGPARRPAQ